MPPTDEPPIPEELKRRLGYPSILKAASFDVGHPIEVGLISPEGSFYDGHMVMVHYDCDPEIRTQGYSEAFGPFTLGEAESEYQREVDEKTELQKAFRSPQRS